MKAMSEKNPDLSEKRKRTAAEIMASSRQQLTLIHISEPTRLQLI